MDAPDGRDNALSISMVRISGREGEPGYLLERPQALPRAFLALETFLNPV